MPNEQIRQSWNWFRLLLCVYFNKTFLIVDKWSKLNEKKNFSSSFFIKTYKLKTDHKNGAFEKTKLKTLRNSCTNCLSFTILLWFYLIICISLLLPLWHTSFMYNTVFGFMIFVVLVLFIYFFSYFTRRRNWERKKKYSLLLLVCDLVVDAIFTDSILFFLFHAQENLRS